MVAAAAQRRPTAMTVGHGLSIETATVISTGLEAILYGFSLLMFIGTVWTLSNRRREQQQTGPRVLNVVSLMILVTLLLLLLSTIHIAINLYRLVVGLTLKGHDSSSAFFINAAQPSYVAKNSVYVTITLVADAVVIFRCYVLWDSFLIVLLPALSWLGTAICGVGSLYSTTHIPLSVNETEGVFAKATADWVHILFSLALFTNLSATGLLAFRIWYLGRTMHSLGVVLGYIWPTISIVLDSGLIYSATLIPLLIGFVINANWQIIFFDIIVPIISIAFYLIILRVGLRSHRSQGRPSTTGDDYSHPISTPRFLSFATHAFPGATTTAGEDTMMGGGRAGAFGLGTMGSVVLDHHRYGAAPYHHHGYGGVEAEDGAGLDKGMAMEMGLLKSKKSSRDLRRPQMEVQVTQGTMTTIRSETTMAVPTPVRTRSGSVVRGVVDGDGEGGDKKAVEVAKEREEEEEDEDEDESGENVRNEPLRFKRPPGTEDVGDEVGL